MYDGLFDKRTRPKELRPWTKVVILHTRRTIDHGWNQDLYLVYRRVVPRLCSEARSPSGKAKVCKTFIGGSIPPRASNVFRPLNSNLVRRTKLESLTPTLHDHGSEVEYDRISDLEPWFRTSPASLAQGTTTFP